MVKVYSWRATNVGRLLFNATDRCVRTKLQIVHRSGFDGVTEAQMALYQNLDSAGTRLTLLASRAGISKSSMIELVAGGEELGLVARKPDPSDARAKIIFLTNCGDRMFTALRAGMKAAEQEALDVLGRDRLLETKVALRQIVELAGAEPTFGWQASPWRADHIGRLMALSARHFSRLIVRYLVIRGYGEIGEGLLALFRNIETDGTRLTDLAARARVTKQSMQEQVNRAQLLGLVVRLPDPLDRRAKKVGLTARGWALLDVIGDGVAKAEARFIETLGREEVTLLKASLTAFAEND